MEMHMPFKLLALARILATRAPNRRLGSSVDVSVTQLSIYAHLSLVCPLLCW